MSATKTTPPAPTRDPADTLCAQCGAELADDQEWCLECGGARTLIHRAADWRLSAAVIAIVVAVALGGFVVALIALTNNASHQPAAAAIAARPSSSVAAPAITTATSRSGAITTPARTAATTPALPAGVASWPVGLPGWTVVLASSHSQSVAYAKAGRIAGTGIQVGVLDSSQHPHLAPGYWVVFSGRYPSRPQALAAATQLIGLGRASAHPRLVGRPGGG
jgi:hypothetical protein